MRAPWEEYSQANTEGPWTEYQAAQPKPAAPNPDFEVAAMSRPVEAQPMSARPDYQAASIGPDFSDVSPTRALLTNEPTQGAIEWGLRNVPPMALAAGAGAVGEAAGIAASPFTAGLSLPAGHAAAVAGAGLAGAGYESGRQGLAQAYAALSGRPFTPPSHVVSNVGIEGAKQALGQASGIALQGAAKFAQSRVPEAVHQFFGPRPEITRYVQERGPGEVFTRPNLEREGALSAIESAGQSLSNARTSVGESIGAAEDFILGSGGASKGVNVSDIAQSLRSTLTQRGYLDPKTGALARGSDVNLLKSALDTLESGQELSVQQLLNTKRLIDAQLEFSQGINKAVSAPAEAIAKNLNAAIREKVRGEMGTGVAQLYDDFGKIASAQEKLAEFTGTKDLSKAELNALRNLRSILIERPQEAERIKEVLGAALPGGRGQAQSLFDSIAAREFSAESPALRSPSNAMLKGLAAVGLTSAPVARTIVRAGEAAVDATAGGAFLIPRLASSASADLLREYMKGKQ